MSDYVSELWGTKVVEPETGAKVSQGQPRSAKAMGRQSKEGQRAGLARKVVCREES